MKYLAVAVSLLSITCITGPQTQEPSIHALPPLSGKRFVAYISPNHTEKPDTVRLSFSFSGLAIEQVTATASLDSGKTWFSIPRPISTDMGKGAIEWVPLLDSLTFGYFGEKTCRLRLEAPSPCSTVESDHFSIIGPLPVAAVAPCTGDTFNLNDTIFIHYQVNSDRISNIRTFFMHGAMADWVEITGSTTRLEGTTLPFREYVTRFQPADYDTLFSNHPGIPVDFLLKDYFSPLPNSTITIHSVVVQ